jgi:hypothetical protein
MGQSPDLAGEFTLSYKDENGVFHAKSGAINKDTQIMRMTGVGGKIRDTSLAFDIAEVPLKERKRYGIDLNMTNVDPRITSKDIYFYAIASHPLSCGKPREQREAKNIDTPERNATLIPLYEAIRDHNVTGVKRFFETMKLPYSVEMQGNRTAVHYAAYFKNAEAIDYLLSKDRAMVDHQDINEKAPLSYVFEDLDIETIKALLKYKPDIENIEFKNTGRAGSSWVLMTLMYRYMNVEGRPNTLAALELFLDAGVSPNTPIGSGENAHKPLEKRTYRTVLGNFIGLGYKNDPLIDLLLKYGAKKSLSDEEIAEARLNDYWRREGNQTKK